ncbi:CSAD decarboxylase, partial [Psilopogon haemacephalus]|nr:CSAD decarboxylase [Psilopogon haemacephalus]
PRFFNQLFSGLDYHALAGRFLTETINTSQYTYEVAPVFVLMEEVVLAKLRELVGWSSGDGIFAPGGSISNMLAINLARFQRFPDSRRRGNWALPRLALFASRESHYSMEKGAALLGIGTDNLRLVPADQRGKMIPEELEKEIEKARAEVRWGQSCPLPCPGALCPVPYPIPMFPAPSHCQMPHPDVPCLILILFPPSHCPRPHSNVLCPILMANSVTWNPHKLLGVGLQCSALLLPDTSGLLKRCHGAGASYLFQPDKFYDTSYDPGDKTPQCGRRVDCLKLWLLWKANGTQGLARRVQRALDATRYLKEQVKRREGFQLVMEPEFINLCFWFVPPSLRGKEGSPDYWSRLGKV